MLSRFEHRPVRAAPAGPQYWLFPPDSDTLPDMFAYLITIHAYRSWSEDNRRGYVQRGRPGIQPPNARLAAHRATISLHEPVRFDREQMSVAIDAAREVCVTLGQLPLAASCTATHLHVLVKLADGTCDADSLCARIKSIAGCKLSQRISTKGNRWFSRGNDITAVKDAAHLEHLLETYLPRHETNEGGLFCRWDRD